MSNEPSPQQQTISLQAISQNFLGALQRQFDLLVYNLAAAAQVNAERYDAISRQLKLMPVPQLHQNFAQTQGYARNLLVRQTFNDLASMASACLNSCHLLCQLIKNQAALKIDEQAANKAVGEAQQAFEQAALNDKFERLEKDFSIMCGTEDAIIAIAVAFRVLMTRNGIVAADDVNEDGELVFEFKTVQNIPPAKEAGAQPEVRVVDLRRVFREGDQLELSNSELLGLSITVTAFFHDLFKAVDEYGARTLGVQPSPDTSVAGQN
ncbi:MAG: hypothetical protein LBG65_01630 [Puniceicoccales bacterium]|jgi:hypothetical protein|nr:hypothetical protein [Puniceicoccales bacterium]